MKILRTLLYILLALVLVLVLLGFVGPKSYDVSRTVEIKAAPTLVLPYVASLKKQNEWGPWQKYDTTMQVSYEGEEGTVGSVSRWEGKQSGKGEQRVTSITGTTVETELTFYMPWGVSKPTGYLHAAEAPGGSEVTWGIRGENDFISRIFAVFMSMEKGVGPMFEEGLQSLKERVESDVNKEYKGYKVNVVDFPARQYIGARGQVAVTDISKFVDQHFARISAALAQANITADGAPSGLYYSWDEKSGANMAAAIPVKTTVPIPDTEVISVAAGKALSIDLYGPYEELTNAHMAIDEFAKSTGVKTKYPVIEEYLTDPKTEPDPKKWLTKIYYLLDQ